jgi:cytochrome c556
MTSKRVAVTVSSCVAIALGMAGLGAALADDQYASQVGARTAQFKLLAFNVGPLAGMAQGNIEYDAAVAQTAADNLATVASVHQERMWPEGSDNSSHTGTRALPSIWANIDDFQAKLEDLRTATRALQGSAGTGLDGMRSGLRGVGQACSACHEDYREPQ